MPKPQKKEQVVESTPIAVQVARYSALAAIITVAGSFLNTMWTERPWWKQEAPVAMVASATEGHVNTDYVHGLNYNDENAKGGEIASVEVAEPQAMSADSTESTEPQAMSADSAEPQESMVMSAAPDDESLLNGVRTQMKNNPFQFWGTILAGLVGSVSTIVEYFHRKKKKCLILQRETEEAKEKFID